MPALLHRLVFHALIQINQGQGNNQKTKYFHLLFPLQNRPNKSRLELSHLTGYFQLSNEGQHRNSQLRFKDQSYDPQKDLD